MSHPISERLSEYLDDDLPQSERAELERHLAHCQECAALVGDLKRVVTRARGLEDRPPAVDLWPGVAALIGAGTGSRHGRRLSFTIPQLLAAGIALMVLTGSAVWLLRVGAPTAMASQPPVAAPAAVPVSNEAERGYDAAVRQLQAALDAGRGRLDTATVRVLEEKLALIDRAIIEASSALAKDPGNLYLSQHLARTRLQKLDLLRRAAGIVRART